MKFFILLLGLALMANDVLGGVGLKTRFELSLSGMGTTFFMPMPHTSELCEEYGWITYTPAIEVRNGLELKCLPNDPTVCVYFSDIGKAAGLQISLDKDTISQALYSFEDQGYTSWTVEVNGTTKDYWSINALFVSDDYQALSKEERQNSYDTNTLIQEKKVWLTGWGGELLEVDATETGILEVGFTKQSCIVWMGHHYFFNMTADTVCSSKTIYPFFLLMRSGELLGIGLNFVGVQTTDENSRDWFERPDASAVKMIVNNGPQCLYDAAADPTVTTMHIYFKDDPQYTTCIFQ